MSVINTFAQPFQTSKCGMPLIEVVDARIESEGTQRPDAAAAQKNLLFQTVLPVSAIKLMGDLAVFRCICFKVSVKKIQICTPDSNFPDSGAHVPSREGHLDGFPYTVLVKNRFSRNFHEVLRLIFSNLVALRGEALCEIPIAV